MTANLQEFIGMVGIVSAATFFVVGLRLAILKIGSKPVLSTKSNTQAIKMIGKTSKIKSQPKKTNQGRGKNSKRYHRGGGPNGSTISKKYKKPYRGQGK